MKVSVVLVHYHAPELVAAAVDSLRRQAADGAVGFGGGRALEIVVVDNGSTAVQRSDLAALPARLVDPGRNLGYGAALNLGVASAGGELLVLANQDLVVAAGALGRLAVTAAERAGDDGAAIVGPAFHWDRGGRLLLPPGERRDRWSDLLSRLAPRGPGWARWARHRWRRHARRHWRATAPLATPSLSGALLVTTRAAWERVGPFDEGFRLYFEETDWLLRAARRGVPVLYEPRAGVHHQYARSTSREGRAAAWFAESEERFVGRWYGPVHRRLRRALAPAAPALSWPPPLLAAPPRLDEDVTGSAAWEGDETWVELSPRATGYPAAAQRLTDGLRAWSLPIDVWERLEGPRWRLALVDASGRERFRASVVPPPSE